MRADRLLRIIMMLQTRGRMSAAALASELEVSERTIYRDVDALSAAGVPLFSEMGRNGGFELLDSYRTRLTGLSGNELRALFALGISGPLGDLGLETDLQSALLKLSASLSDARRTHTQTVRQRILLDASWWQRDEPALPHLRALHEAIWAEQRIEITYRALSFLNTVQTVEPYSLATKAGIWYLVYCRQSKMRVRRVSTILEARPFEETFARDPRFDLPSFWEHWVSERNETRRRYTVTVRVARRIIPYLAWYLGNAAANATEAGADSDDWVDMQLAFESVEEARSKLLACGSSIEVIDPPALRLGIADVASQIVAMY